MLTKPVLFKNVRTKLLKVKDIKFNFFKNYSTLLALSDNV